ncbi:MAG: hypothetical protein K8F91_04595 [Candidatus Obscuribacterales bacterium]|nr:hypothetical protein [Candidatus Obscuribacterales bacterium]
MFEGNDPVSLHQGIEFENLTFDGATTEDLLSSTRINALSEYVDKVLLVMLTTVYDPTDGTGMMPGTSPWGDFEVELLVLYNEFIRRWPAMHRD